MLLLIIMLQASIATAENEGIEAACWQSETNPRTQKPFSSREEFDATKREWRSITPESGPAAEMIKALQVGQQEKRDALKLGSDKRAHCYLGCRISQETSAKTAVFVGWQKEDSDLTDCKPSTHFEPRDFEVTALGAKAAEQMPKEKVACKNFCVKEVELRKKSRRI